MGSQLNTLPPHNDNYPSRMCGVVVDKYVWRSDVEKGRGAAKSRKGDDMRPPLRLHNLNDCETDRGLSWIILRPIAEYVESSEIILPGLSKTLANTSLQCKVSVVTLSKLRMFKFFWQPQNLIQDSNESKSLILTTEWDNPRAWYIIESSAPWSTEPWAGLTLDDWPDP